MKLTMSDVRRIIDPVSRIIVGGLFIFSGLIKINDPVGTKIKMEEYFEVFTADFGSFFHVFIPWALEIAMIMIVLEIALGVAVLLYYEMKVTTWVLLGLMVFFTFLTFYSAVFDKVTDCGCFGDAIKLTPWESFYKDIFLMVFVLHLFWYRRHFKGVLTPGVGHSVIGGTALVSLFIGVYAVRHLPYLDFRPYKIGNIIPEQMIPEEQPIIEYTFEKGGEEVQSTKFLSDKEGYKYLSSRVINEDKITPKITDYRVTSPDGEDLTQYTFEGNRLLITLDVATAATKTMDRLRDLTRGLEGKVDCFVLTSSGAAEMEAFRHEHQLAVPYYYADATVLKTIVRSNPGITLWRDGKVLGKWHYHDVPTAEEVLSLL